MLPWHWYCCPNPQVSCFSFANQNIVAATFGEFPLEGLLGPVCPVLLPFLSANVVVGIPEDGTCCCRSIWLSDVSNVISCLYSAHSLFSWRENYFPEEEQTGTATLRGYDPHSNYLFFQTDHSCSVERMWGINTCRNSKSTMLLLHCRGPSFKEGFKTSWKTAIYPVCDHPHSNTKYSFLTVLLLAAVKWRVSAWGKSLAAHHLKCTCVQFNHRLEIQRNQMIRR